MTHKYTLLVDAVVIPGSGAPDATAIAWAEDTVIAIGSDEDVASISRGDSHVFKLAGATVAPSVGGVLEVGGSADLDVTDNDPRASALGDARLLAVVRGGKVVEGTLPGASGGHDHGHHDH